MATIPPAERAPAGCLDPEDRTAFALGQLLDVSDESRRADISRHLLRCPTCRADVDSISILGSRLSSFGSGGDWEADVGAALAAERGRLRVRRRAAFAGFAAAASVVTALWIGVGRNTRSPESDARPVANSVAMAGAPEATSGGRALEAVGTPIERARLLAAQGEDGRFSAASTVGGARHDEAATGLAVLALIGESRTVPKDAESARAIAAAVRWLRTRQGASGRFGPEATSLVRDQAIATAALLEVSIATGDADLRASADRAVRTLRLDVRDRAADGADGGEWARYALARARDVATGHATEASPAMDDAFVAEHWPMGLGGGTSVLGRTLAVVEKGSRE